MATPKYSSYIWLYSHSLKPGKRHPRLSWWKKLNMKCTGLSRQCVNQCLANTKCGHSAWAAIVGRLLSLEPPAAPTGLRQKLHSTFSPHLLRGLDQALQALISEAQDCGKEKKKHLNNFLLCFVLFCLVIFKSSFYLWLAKYTFLESDYSFNMWIEFNIYNFTITVFLWLRAILLNIVFLDNHLD